MRPLGKTLLLLLLLGLLLTVFARRFQALAPGSDFVEFYAAAMMLRHGAGHQMYSVAAQQEFQAKYTGRIGTYFNHPPFEALLYLPFSLGSLSQAYFAWNMLNLVLLGITARLLQRYAFTPLDWRVLLAFLFLFPPLSLNFLQGQDSILLLFLFTLAFAQLQREKADSAGGILACGLFKFHLVLPFLFVLLTGKSKKLLAGFSLAGFLLLLISAAVCGWEFLAAYPRFLLQLRAEPLAGIYPQAMPNLRGLLAVGLPVRPFWELASLTVLSLLVLGCAVWGWSLSEPHWGSARKLAFSNALMAAVLAGYHLSPHDLVLLSLPLALIAQHLLNTPQMPGWLRGSMAGVGLILFLPPMHILLLARHEYAYAGLPVVFLFAASFVEIRRLALALPGC